MKERGGMAAPVALLSVLLLVAIGYAAAVAPDVATATVVGKAECSDCAGVAHSFQGIQVAVVCKAASGKYEAKGVSALDRSGNFAVSLPREFTHAEGRLQRECFAQLYASGKSSPCPTQQSLDHFQIVLHPKASADVNLRLFTTAASTLRFSRSACASATLWPTPKLPIHPWFKTPVVIPKTPKFPPLVKNPFPKFPPVPKFTPLFKKPVAAKLPPVFKRPVAAKFPPLFKRPIAPKFPPLFKRPIAPKFPPLFKRPIAPKFPPLFKRPIAPKFPPLFKRPIAPKFPPLFKRPIVPKFPPVFKRPIAPKFPPLFKRPIVPKFPHALEKPAGN